MTNPSFVYTRNTYKTYVQMCENVYPLTNPSIHVRIRKKLWKYAEIKIWRWRFTTEKTCHFWPLGGARMHKTIGLLRHLSVDNQSCRTKGLAWLIYSIYFLFRFCRDVKILSFFSISHRGIETCQIPERRYVKNFLTPVPKCVIFPQKNVLFFSYDNIDIFRNKEWYM